MNISLKSEYALQAVFDLANRNSSEPVKIADIAHRQKIPQKFLELILAGLKQGGFVESRRGAEGGYLLARPAERLTLGEVIRHMEGERSPRSRGRKRGDTATAFTETWERVDTAVAAILDQTTFAELRERWRDRQAAAAPSWDI